MQHNRKDIITSLKKARGTLEKVIEMTEKGICSHCGCTREAIDFTRLESAFAEAGAAVVGISADTVELRDVNDGTVRRLVLK